MRKWESALPVDHRVENGPLSKRIQEIVDSLPHGDGPHGITIGRRAKPPRILVFTGTCSESDVQRIRGLLKASDNLFEASLVVTPGKLHAYRTATREHPNGS